MPIYEETYRPWHGHKVTHPRTGWVIGKTGFKLLWKKLMIMLVLLAAMGFVAKGVELYFKLKTGSQIEQFAQGLTEAMPQAKNLLDVDAHFFLKYMQDGIFLFILVMISAGGGLIANDRKFKALSIYFSKPVNFWDYVWGKFGVLGGYGSIVMLFPSWLLFLTAVLLGENNAIFKAYWWIPLSQLATSTLLIAVWGLLIMALSAISKSTRTAAILAFGLYIFPEMVRAILSKIPSIGLFSIQAICKQIMAVFFGERLPYNFSPWIGAAVLLLTIGASLAIIRWRVKPTEVVG